MANRKITDLTELTTPASDDVLPIVDISETSNTTKNKKITVSNLIENLTDVDLKLANGTEAAPSLAFTSSTSTGLYRSAANELSITTNGGQAIKVESNNKTTIYGDLVVTGGTTTISSTQIDVNDKNLQLATGNSSDSGADGGGLTVKGATDKTWNWVASTDAWTANQHIDVTTGKVFKIAGTEVLSATTLGAGIVNSSLTSVGTLGSLTVTNAVTAGSLDISGGADIDGTLEADAYTVNGTALNEYIADTVGAMVSSNTESDIVVTYQDSDNTLDFTVSNISGTSGGLSGTPNITVGVVTGGSLDISGNADIDGTLEADAYTVNGTALNEYIADTVGAMVSSNTETNIAVTYDDSDNTLDFVISSYPAASISGTTLASNVVTSSLTSVGTLGSLNVTNTVTANLFSGSGASLTALNADNISSGTLASARIEDSAITSAKILDGTIVNADINASAAIAGTKISPDFGSQNIATTGAITSTGNITTNGQINIESTSPRLHLADSNSEDDFSVYNLNGVFTIYNEDDNRSDLTIDSSGQVDISGNLDANGGLDVTGNITVTGTVDGVDIAARNTLFGGLTSSSGVLSNGVTATTQSASDNSTKVATTAYTDTAISNLIDSSPGTLNTLNELAAALGDDANFSTTVTNSIATKAVLSGSTNNTICTVTGANAITGEGNLTFNGSGDLTVKGNDGISANLYLIADRGDNNGDGWRVGSNQDANDLTFANNATGSYVDKVTLTGDKLMLSVDLKPDTTNQRDFGTNGNRFKDAYFTGTVTAGTFSGSGASLTSLNASNLGSGTVATARLGSGTASSSVFLRGDGTWSSVSAGSASSLSGLTASQFLRSDANDDFSGQLTSTYSSDEKIVLSGSSDPYIRFKEGTNNKAYIQWNAAGYIEIVNQGDNSRIKLQDNLVFTNDGWSNTYKIWNESNDGSGSGLDADKLDGFQASQSGGANTVAVYNSSGYLSVQNWIYVANATGLYAPGGSHFYNGGASTWQSWINQSTHSTACGIGMRSSGTIRGWAYATDTHVGFLNNGGNWLIRAPQGNNSAPETGAGHTIWHSGNDGSGSTLDADTLDGRDSNTGSVADTIALRDSSSNLTTAGFITTGGSTHGLVGVAYATSYFGLKTTSQTLSSEYMIISADTHTFISANSGHNVYIRGGGNSSTNELIVSTTGPTIGGWDIWHGGNDGSGSGLDADKLDGSEATKFLSSYDRTTTTGWEDANKNFRINGGGTNSVGIAMHDSAGTFQFQLYGSNGTTYGFLNGNWAGWDIKKTISGNMMLNNNDNNIVWHQGNDGSGSGLDADTLDGFQTSQSGGANKVLVSDSSQYLILDSWMRVGNGQGLYAAGGSHLYNGGASTWQSWINQSTNASACGIGMRSSQGTIRGWNYADTAHVGLLNAGGNWLIKCPIGDANAPQTGGGYTLWHSGNDGAGSGLDADLWDGDQKSTYLNQAVLTTSSVTFNNLYSNAWLRNNDSTEGLYNTANTTHWYSSTSSYWDMDNNGNNGGIRFRDNHESTIRGYVYYNSSSNIGFLNNGGSWIVQCNSARETLFHGHVYPSGTHNLGSTSMRWNNIYVNDLQLSNESKKDEGGNDVDGTWGDWTLQEGDENIFMINNRSGKKYKIALQEV